MSKYYDEKEIWRKLKEELSEFDIDHQLFYKLDEDGFSFDEYEFEICDSIDIIQDLIMYGSYVSLSDYELEAIKDIAEYLKIHKLYEEMMISRDKYMQYIFSIPHTREPNDDELTKYSNDFEFKAEIYLWCKHIFPAVLVAVNKLLYERLEVINFAFDAIRRN